MMMLRMMLLLYDLLLKFVDVLVVVVLLNIQVIPVDLDDDSFVVAFLFVVVVVSTLPILKYYHSFDNGVVEYSYLY